MTWARAFIFYGSDLGKRRLEERGHSSRLVTVALPPLVLSTTVQLINMPIIRARCGTTHAEQREGEASARRMPVRGVGVACEAKGDRQTPDQNLVSRALVFLFLEVFGCVGSSKGLFSLFRSRERKRVRGCRAATSISRKRHTENRVD